MPITAKLADVEYEKWILAVFMRTAPIPISSAIGHILDTFIGVPNFFNSIVGCGEFMSVLKK